jgi:hypothetical protein
MSKRAAESLSFQQIAGHMTAALTLPPELINEVAQRLSLPDLWSLLCTCHAAAEWCFTTTRDLMREPYCSHLLKNTFGDLLLDPKSMRRALRHPAALRALVHYAVMDCRAPLLRWDAVSVGRRVYLDDGLKGFYVKEVFMQCAETGQFVPLCDVPGVTTRPSPAHLFGPREPLGMLAEARYRGASLLEHPELVLFFIEPYILESWQETSPYTNVEYCRLLARQERWRERRLALYHEFINDCM